MNVIKNCKLLTNKIFKFNHLQKCDYALGHAPGQVFEQNKTLVDLVSQNQEVRYIKGISNFGFRLNNGLFVVGPIVIFNEILLSWNVRNAKEINPHSLSLFRMFVPKFEVLILGVGDDMKGLHPDLLPYLSRNRVPYEINTTKEACKLYNALVIDKRNVAACLIPQEGIGIPDKPDIEDYTKLGESKWKHDLINEHQLTKIFYNHYEEFAVWLQEKFMNKEELKKKIAAQNYEQSKRLAKMEFKDAIAEEIQALKEEEKFHMPKDEKKKSIHQDDHKTPVDPDQKLIK